MNPAALAIRLRPRTLLETCDLGLTFVREHLRVYVTAWSLALGLPVAMLYAAKEFWGLPWTLVWAIAVVWCSLAQGVFTLIFADLVFRSDARLGGVFARFFRGFARYVFALTVSRILFLLGAGTVVLAPRMLANGAFIPEIVLLEGMSGTAALRRGRRLSGTLGDSEFTYFALTLALYAGIVGMAEMLGVAILQTLLQLGARFGSLLDEGGSLYALLGFACTVPVLSTMRLISYVGGRAEQDGWDVQLSFQAIAGREGRGR